METGDQGQAYGILWQIWFELEKSYTTSNQSIPSKLMKEFSFKISVDGNLKSEPTNPPSQHG